MIDLTLSELRKKISSGCTIIDLRSSGEFASGFIPGSIFFSEDVTSKQFSFFLNKSTDIVVVGGTESKKWSGVEELVATGFKIAGVYERTIDEWKNSGYAIDMLIEVDTDELSIDLRFDKKLVLIDLRDKENFLQSHVRGSVNVPLSEITDVAQVAAMDEKGCIYLYEKTEANAMLAASWIKKLGLHNIRVVQGGWKDIVKDGTIKIEKAIKAK